MKLVHTGCSIKIRPYSFNHTCSHDKNPSNFKTALICYYTELSFEVYKFFSRSTGLEMGSRQSLKSKTKMSRRDAFY